MVTGTINEQCHDISKNAIDGKKKKSSWVNITGQMEEEAPSQTTEHKVPPRTFLWPIELTHSLLHQVYTQNEKII